MLRKWVCVVISVICLIMVSASVSAYTISDKDGDGCVEVGETITFIGDDYVVESDGDEHHFVQWAWDFDGDFEIDAYGQEVKHTYETPGLYRGYLYEIGDVGYSFTLEIEVYISGDYSSKDIGGGQASGWYKNGGPGNGNHYGITGK